MPTPHRTFCFLSALTLLLLCASLSGCQSECPHDRLMLAEGLSQKKLAVTCAPSMEVYPIAGPHNGGYDQNALDFSCHPHPGASPDNSDWITGVHLGNDLFALKGTPVVSPVSGTIVYLGYTSVGGNRVTIEDGCGWRYYLAHLDTITEGLAPGMSVSAGQSLGTVGNTGSAINTAPHVHFSIYPDDNYAGGVDPFPYLQGVDADACDESAGGGSTAPEDPPPSELEDPSPSEPEDPSPSEPALTLSTLLTPPTGQGSDLRPEGSSLGVFDLYEGQSATYEVWLENAHDAAVATEVALAVDFELSGVTPRSWSVYSDYPQSDQATWSPNDANEHPSNPPQSAPPSSGVWHLYALSPGETKRLVFDIEATAYSLGTEPQPELRAWLYSAADYYAQGEWGGPATTNLAGALVQEALALHVYSGREWHFEGELSDETEGWWGLGSGDQPINASGALTLELPPPLAGLWTDTARFDAEVYSGVRMGISLSVAKTLRVSFATEDAPQFSPERSLTRELEASAGSTPVEVHLGHLPGWEAAITKLSLSFSGGEEGAIAIDFIEAALVDAPPVAGEEGASASPEVPEDPAEQGPSPRAPQPGAGPCVPGNLSACKVDGAPEACGLGVMTCLESGVWGVCLMPSDCERADERSRPGVEASNSDASPTIEHVGHALTLSEGPQEGGCSGSRGGGPLLGLLFALSALGLRRRRLVLAFLALGLFGCGGELAGEGTGEIPTAEGQNQGFRTTGDVITPGERGTSSDPSADASVPQGDAVSSPEANPDTQAPGPGDEGAALCESPGSAGCGCLGNDDCGVGLTCLGSLCVPPCDSGCPEGWVCAETLSACLPPHAMLCAPCSADADCLTPEATCVSLGVAGSYCGTPCETNSACPDGFSCQALGTGSDAPKRCLPPGESCACSGLAKAQGSTTACFAQVEGELCAGLRSCGPDGLSACEPSGVEGGVCGDAEVDPDPGPTSCDGVDCDDDNPCTADLCDAGTCSYTFTSASCDDGDPCTSGDQCSEGVCVPGVVGVELCNGKDDDCDGGIDEALSQSCGTLCGEGSEICVAGQWAGCSAPPLLCDPAEACCGANGCAFVSAGTLCGDGPQSTSTSCEGSCGGEVILDELWLTCSGQSEACGDGGTTMVQAEVEETCGASELCVEGATGAACSPCPHGCEEGACSEVQETSHVVCIDPGYGGPNPGPVGAGTTGAAVTWSIAMHLVDWLEADSADASGGASWSAVLTRGEAEDPSWSARSEICNQAGSARLLAIYSNAFNGAADGSETHFRAEDGAEAELLATFVQAELLEHGGLDDRGLIDETWLILSGTSAPGAMTFVGFLDNAGDGAQMADDAWRAEVAKGFMHALQQAMGAEPYTP